MLLMIRYGLQATLQCQHRVFKLGVTLYRRHLLSCDAVLVPLQPPDITGDMPSDCVLHVCVKTRLFEVHSVKPQRQRQCPAAQASPGMGHSNMANSFTALTCFCRHEGQQYPVVHDLGTAAGSR